MLKSPLQIIFSDASVYISPFPRLLSNVISLCLSRRESGQWKYNTSDNVGSLLIPPPTLLLTTLWNICFSWKTETKAEYKLHGMLQNPYRVFQIPHMMSSPVSLLCLGLWKGHLEYRVVSRSKLVHYCFCMIAFTYYFFVCSILWKH